MAFCTHCGTQSVPGSRFCHQCGVSFTGQPTAGTNPQIDAAILSLERELAAPRRRFRKLVRALFFLFLIFFLLPLVVATIAGEYNHSRSSHQPPARLTH